MATDANHMNHITPIRPQISREDAFRIINAFALDILSFHDEGDLFWHVVRNVVGKLGFPDCIVYQANREQTKLTQVAALGQKNPTAREISNPLVIDFRKGITGSCASDKKSIIIGDLSQDLRYIPDEEPALSEIAVPLIYGNYVAGVIDCEHPEGNAFSALDLEILETIAAMTSAKLQLLFEAGQSAMRFEKLQDAHENLKNETQMRKKLETQLLIRRKMEAIGKFTGGIAHDFNNLLTVILSALELITLRGVKLDGETQEQIHIAMEAGKDGQKLLKNIMVYGRNNRQFAEVLNLNEIVQKVANWRTEPIPHEITTKLMLCTDVHSINVDPIEIENVILNLIINAKDAMQMGGELSIITQNIELTEDEAQSIDEGLNAGKYVLLRVCDTGMGISASQIEEIFDPFFTTKDKNQRYGMGLSQVFGFVNASGAGISVSSQVGKGTSFSLYFQAVL